MTTTSETIILIVSVPIFLALLYIAIYIADNFLKWEEEARERDRIKRGREYDKRMSEMRKIKN